MRTQPVKVNRLVTWINASGKLRPAIVTSVVSQSVVNLRVGRRGETVLAALKQTADNQTSVWRISDAFQKT